MNYHLPRLALLLLLLAPPTLSRQRADAPWLWSEEAELLEPAGAYGFGCSVALDGDTLLIGARAEHGDGGNRGAAYVFVQSGPSWMMEARLVPSDPANDAQFGWAVALQGDTALVAMPCIGNGAIPGAVYVFLRSAGVWTEVAKLTPPDGGGNDRFGYSVAFTGNAVLIGAPYHDAHSGVNEGAAYMFTGSGTSWNLLQKIVASDVADCHGFGTSVALYATTALIGADVSRGIVPYAGAAYVFTKYGGAWHEQTKLFASDGVSDDRFGVAVALDGDTAVVGAYRNDDAGEDTGSAYVFERSGSSWSQTQKLLASDATASDRFGKAVALQDDTLMVGASYYGTMSRPAGVYVFHREGATWSEVEKHGQGSSQGFGHDIALRGSRSVIGAPYDSPGHAYIYSRTPESGFGFCFGDAGSGTPCPCNNDNDGSLPGAGCDNGAYASGAQLIAYGTPSVAADEVFLRTIHVEPYNSGLYFQGSQRVNGGDGVVFGDGLRCAGGQVKRLQVTFADELGTTSTTIPLATKGQVSPGDIRWYQYWYRTTVAPPCGLWLNDFNTSNGYSITWLP